MLPIAALYTGILTWCLDRLAWAIAPHLPVDNPHIRSRLEPPADPAEEDLLFELRGRKSENFKLYLSRCNGEWEVTTDNDDGASEGTGYGNTFQEAWFSRERSAWPASK